MISKFLITLVLIVASTPSLARVSDKFCTENTKSKDRNLDHSNDCKPTQATVTGVEINTGNTQAIDKVKRVVNLSKSAQEQHRQVVGSSLTESTKAPPAPASGDNVESAEQ